MLTEDMSERLSKPRQSTTRRRVRTGAARRRFGWVSLKPSLSSSSSSFMLTLFIAVVMSFVAGIWVGSIWFRFGVPNSVGPTDGVDAGRLSLKMGNPANKPTTDKTQSSVVSSLKRFLDSSSTLLRGEKPRDFVERRIAGFDVTVFAKSTCPYCIHTLSVLRSLQEQIPGWTLEVVFFDLMENQKDVLRIREYLNERTNQHTVPNIFIGQKHIGGDSDLQELVANKELEKRLTELTEGSRSQLKLKRRPFEWPEGMFAPNQRSFDT